MLVTMSHLPMTLQICQSENQKLDCLLAFPAIVIASLKLSFHFPAGDKWDLVPASIYFK